MWGCGISGHTTLYSLEPCDMRTSRRSFLSLLRKCKQNLLSICFPFLGIAFLFMKFWYSSLCNWNNFFMLCWQFANFVCAVICWSWMLIFNFYTTVFSCIMCCFFKWLSNVYVYEQHKRNIRLEFKSVCLKEFAVTNCTQLCNIHKFK